MSAPTFFATAARGLEPLLARELQGLGAASSHERGGGVEFTGGLEVAYRACLWSRLASRVLLPLKRFGLEGTDASGQIYAAAREVNWLDQFDVSSKFAVEVAGRSASISHTHYAGLKLKDAIVDVFREQRGERPSVDTTAPDLRVHLHLSRNEAVLSLDLSGESLHRRGYRRSSVEAPLRENLAAAILMRAGWPELVHDAAPLLDPMCGSGTLVIEAALMAADVAPGLSRRRFGFEAWLDHKPSIWRELREEAQARGRAGLASSLPDMRGSDVSPPAVQAAKDNATRAGLANKVQFVVQDLTRARPHGETPGLVVTNPPYGERLGDEAQTIKLHSLLGETLKQHFAGWQACVFTGSVELGKRLGLWARDKYALYNGALPCTLLLFDLGTREVPQDAPVGGEDFANRLAKNLKHLGKWAKRNQVTNYRAYDADLTEYAVAVDRYETGDGLHIHVQEYAAPKTIDRAKAEKRLRQALAHTRLAFDVPADRLHYKLRRSQDPRKAGAQYGKQADTGRFHEIEEHGCRLLVNFDDYLDTGLFLDHRPIRLRIQKEAAGRRFLNLFCYTASATAHAVHGGAVGSVSVDLSNTYLEWGQRNLALNGTQATIADGRTAPAGKRSKVSAAPHQLLRADCLEWLREQAAAKDGPKFDLILCDPPTFSNSKRMDEVLDVQRDHATLVRHAAALLAPAGVLYFSTNRRSFKLDGALFDELSIRDITAQTLDEDFRRPPPAHKCWEVRNRG